MQQETQLRNEVVALLTDPNVYLSAYGVIFPQESLQRGTFWPLIHGLARHGVYLMEGDTAVNHTVLAQNNPFREVRGSMWSKWHIAHFDPLWSLAVTLAIPQLHEWRLLGARLASTYIMCSNKCPTVT